MDRTVPTGAAIAAFDNLGWRVQLAIVAALDRLTDDRITVFGDGKAIENEVLGVDVDALCGFLGGGMRDDCSD